jgi:hypothetical protein
MHEERIQNEREAMDFDEYAVLTHPKMTLFIWNMLLCIDNCSCIRA